MVGGSRQQRSDWNHKLARSGDRQECMASWYPPTQAHNPILISDKVEQEYWILPNVRDGKV